MSHQTKDVLGGKSVGQLLVEGFEEFAAELQRDRTKIPEKFTCHQLSLELRQQHYSPELVKKTRGILRASQAVFAKFLGVSLHAVQSWEQGVNAPKESACRMMDEIRHNPPYWQARICELFRTKNGKRSSRTRA